MSERFPHDINGIKLTEHQYAVLRAFVGDSHRSSERTVWTLTERGGINWGYDNNRSSTEPVFRALAKKGIFEVREEEFTPHGWNRSIKREVFTLTPGPAQYFRELREASRIRAAEREAERQAKQDADLAVARAHKREREAREMAVRALITLHPEDYSWALEQAYKSIDTTAAGVAAGESIQSIKSIQGA